MKEVGYRRQPEGQNTVFWFCINPPLYGILLNTEKYCHQQPSSPLNQKMPLWRYCCTFRSSALSKEQLDYFFTTVKSFTLCVRPTSSSDRLLFSICPNVLYHMKISTASASTLSKPLKRSTWDDDSCVLLRL